MPDQTTIAENLELLEAHRRTLHQLLKQEALSGEVFVPPALSNGIDDARAEIARLKSALRGWGVAVDDEPADTPSPPPQLASLPARALRLPPALWLAVGAGIMLLLVVALGLARSQQPAAAAPTVVPSVAPTIAPTVVPSVVPTIAPTAVPSVAPTMAPEPVFLLRYPFNVEALELVELVPEPGVVSARPITDTLKVTALELGEFAETSRPAWNIRLTFTNTRDQPVLLDFDGRFFALTDDQGRAAERVYFCCAAKGVVLGAGQSRELQLLFRPPDGWFGKGIAARSITIEVSGLLPIARVAWRFPAPATAS